MLRQRLPRGLLTTGSLAIAALIGLGGLALASTSERYPNSSRSAPSLMRTMGTFKSLISARFSDRGYAERPKHRNAAYHNDARKRRRYLLVHLTSPPQHRYRRRGLA